MIHVGVISTEVVYLHLLSTPHISNDFLQSEMALIRGKGLNMLSCHENECVT